MRSKNVVLARGVCAVAAAAALLVPGTARAKGNLGIGLIGAVGGNFLDKVDRPALEPAIYPGFGGLTMGGGLMLDGRVLDGLLGLEVDVIRSNDKGSGTVTLNGIDFKVTLGQPAWHVPILAKITIPSPLIAPSFFLGPEVVLPGTPDTTVSNQVLLPTQVGASADTYVMITGGLGMEIKLPLPVLDLRIPIGLRGSYAPGVSGDYADRVKHDPAFATVTYRTEWKFAVNLTAGAAIYF